MRVRCREDSCEHPTVAEALQLLRALQPIPAELKRDLYVLAQRLDEEYFDLQEDLEHGRSNAEGWTRAFSRARALSALAFASGETAFDAATEAIYEAMAIVDSNDEISDLVLRVLAGRHQATSQ